MTTSRLAVLAGLVAVVLFCWLVREIVYSGRRKP